MIPHMIPRYLMPHFDDWIRIGLAFGVALLVAWLLTPPVKSFAEHVGAIDVPKDARRVHDHPIPRMGGLAIFSGFLLAVLLFVNISTQVLGIVLGAIIIVLLGAIDDIISLKPGFKLLGQIIAAVVAIRCGVVFWNISNPNVFSNETFIFVGWLSIPLTLLWIVGCTNAVNLIDGLDGLAVGVSAIGSLTMLIISLYVSEPVVSIMLAALVGACIGFMPYNLNPAKIFMGDVGSQFLGFVLATVSILGVFKFHAIISFFVPVLALAVPIADTTFAFARRIAHGQSPFKADRGHFHHRLLAAGMSQKQAVAVIYGISAVFGLIALFLTGSSLPLRVLCLALALAISLVVWLFAFRGNHRLRAHEGKEPLSQQKQSAHDDQQVAVAGLPVHEVEDQQ